MDPEIARLLSAASNALRTQFKPAFIAQVDLSLHNKRLQEVNESIKNFFMANLADTHQNLMIEFKRWIGHTMHLIYRTHLKGQHDSVQVFRKNYLGTTLGDIFVCCAEMIRVLFYAYNIEVEKNDSGGFVEVCINKELGNTIFKFI